MNPQSPITIVTGASGALGSAVVERLLAEQHRVVAMGRARGGLPDDGSLGDRLMWVELNLMDAAAWHKALADIEVRFGPPTGAALCAGGWGGGRNVSDGEDPTVWRRMFEGNLETAVVSIRTLLPGMAARQRGSIVIIGSRAVERPWESTGAAAYAAAKGALVSYAKVVAQETLAQRVRINAVLPSTIDTPANRAAMPQADSSKWVSPTSIADVIAFLLSDAASDISGTAIPVYGRA